ncbi:MAG: Hsp20/alpha crystallin family protein [Calditrichaeota bacterium]|nr:Hsp20/alpha crystallin family protein [Calditrichota bacterium]MCB0286423.1 Hsp20/alpha crystallin family protein [Calditrichota bacterium]MCB9067651.1 Hsp20/alpha crystallin family protein [Calditrichia bacterium]
MKLERWIPARDLFRAHDEMGRLIDQFFSNDVMGGSAWDASSDWLPGMDVQEDENQFTVYLELPGLTKKDVNITFTNNTLSIKGEKKRESEEKKANYHRVERNYGKFKRSVTMPTRIQDGKIDARFKDGVLTITLPKAEEVKPKAIEVKVEG